MELIALLSVIGYLLIAFAVSVVLAAKNQDLWGDGLGILVGAIWPIAIAVVILGSLGCFLADEIKRFWYWCVKKLNPDFRSKPPEPSDVEKMQKLAERKMCDYWDSSVGDCRCCLPLGHARIHRCQHSGVSTNHLRKVPIPGDPEYFFTPEEATVIARTLDYDPPKEERL